MTPFTIYPNIKTWRDACITRDGHTCKLCGVTSFERKIVVHHIAHRSQYPTLSYALQNGVSCCVPCHIRVLHSKFSQTVSASLIDSMFEVYGPVPQVATKPEPPQTNGTLLKAYRKQRRVSLTELSQALGKNHPSHAKRMEARELTAVEFTEAVAAVEKIVAARQASTDPAAVIGEVAS